MICHFVLRGRGYIETAQARISVAAGSVIIVPPGTEKDIVGSEPVNYEINAGDSCQDYGERLLRFRANADQASLVICCATVSATSSGRTGLLECLVGPVSAVVADNPLFAAGLNLLLEDLADPQIGATELAACLMKQAVVLLLREQIGTSDASWLDHVGDRRVVRAVGSMLRMPGASHSIESLSVLAGMSRSSFMKHFTREYGKTPGQFLQAARMQAAARMLVGSDIAIRCVAPAVGYASRSQFSRTFKQVFGVDPSAYRLTVPAKRGNPSAATVGC